jgi:hypothetical protein
MRYTLIVLWILFWSAPAAIAQLSIGIGLPGVSIGINLPVYPEFVRVPGYPVYYAPRLSSNYFFYDGMYWVYQDDNWYASSWYNGPWGMVGPEFVPVYVLRIPVRYYRQPPPYFRGWRRDAPPRWGNHWGNEWEQRHSGWNRWDRRSAPEPAPLPVYQQQYLGDRYPRVEQQHELHNQNYRYQPQDAVVQQYYQEREVQVQRAPAASQREQQRDAVSQDKRQPPQQGATQREQPTRNSSRENIPQDQEKGASKEPRQDEEQDREKGKDQERGQKRDQGRNR